MMGFGILASILHKTENHWTTLTYGLISFGLTSLVVWLMPHTILLGTDFLTWVIIICISGIIAVLLTRIKGLVHPFLIISLSPALISKGLFEAIHHGHFFLPISIFGGMTVVAAFVILSYVSGKIDMIGTLAGGVIALGLFLGGSWGSLGLLFVFFVAGIFVSSWKKKEKKSLKLDQENDGKRSINNAVSNGGVAGLLGFLAWIFPEQASTFLLMIAASLAAANSDTFSSELGNVYGNRFINILTFKTDQRGKDGVISLEGSLFGLLGSSIVAIAFGLWNEAFYPALAVFFAGYLGNMMDSILGATLQQKGLMNNDTVNFGCTLFAASLVGVFG